MPSWPKLGMQETSIMVAATAQSMTSPRPQMRTSSHPQLPQFAQLGGPGGSELPPGRGAAGAGSSGAPVGGKGVEIRTRRNNQEGCPSGQREQTVNLPAHAFEGSNPSPSTNFGSNRGNSSVGRASAFQAECNGFESRFPLHDVKEGKAHLAQLAEHVLGKDEVTSSILVVGSKERLP